MKKFLLLLTFLTTTLTYSQSYDLTDIYGRWMNFDGTQTLYMNYKGESESDTFYRVFDGGFAYGQFEVKDKYIYVTKGDLNYKLNFHLKGYMLIVLKPESEESDGQAWLFRKVSNQEKEPILEGELIN
tara:strand:+ start:268 stop:651 length:384 start_codon:yes stop_codon:yes gene_type:complete